MWGEKVYVPAIMGASGITIEQAKTCLYYAVATYLIPNKLKIMPILAIIGPLSTGKTSLLNQLLTMVNDPDLILAESTPTLRDKLSKTTTACIEEGDTVDEELLIKRYDQNTGKISYKVSYGGGIWRTRTIHVFGATIIVRRLPFKNPATASRSIVINTEYREGDYKIRKFRKVSDNLEKKSQSVRVDKKPSQRIRNNWMPLQAVARAIGDAEWLEYSEKEIRKDTRNLKGSQTFEPRQAVLMVMKEQFDSNPYESTLLLSAIKNGLKSEFDVHLTIIQIKQICRELGFRTVSHAGYPKVKRNQRLLEKLCKERKL